MANVTVLLPDPVKAWVDEQARAGRYGDAADYIRALIWRERDRAAWVAELQPLIDTGLASGTSDRSMKEVRQDARAAAWSASRDCGF